MKRICTLILAAGLVFGAATGASAIDFKAKGQWLMGFSAGNNSLTNTTRENNTKSKGDTGDGWSQVVPALGLPSSMRVRC